MIRRERGSSKRITHTHAPHKHKDTQEKNASCTQTRLVSCWRNRAFSFVVLLIFLWGIFQEETDECRHKLHALADQCKYGQKGKVRSHHKRPFKTLSMGEMSVSLCVENCAFPYFSKEHFFFPHTSPSERCTYCAPPTSHPYGTHTRTQVFRKER